MAYPIFVNDGWVSPDKAYVSVKDIGFLRGYGIFDFFRIMDGQAIFLTDHLDRFLSSADKMGIEHTYSKADLLQLIVDLAKTAKDSCLGVKMVLTGGDSMNGFEPMEGKSNLFIFPGVFAFANPTEGMHLISQKYHREMADIKSLNYAFAIRHWADMKRKGGSDLIYYTDELGVSESSRSNLFFVKSDVIYTPGQQILAGITRSHVLNLASKEFEVRVGDYSLSDFLSADEVFTTGSTKRVLPIFSIDGKQINGAKRGPLTSYLYDLLVKSER